MKCFNCGKKICYDPAETVSKHSDWRHVRTGKRKCDLEGKIEYAEPDFTSFPLRRFFKDSE
jgi:hypothetical protein